MRRARITLALVAAAAAALGGGCGGDETAPDEEAVAENAVSIETFIYEPDPIEIEAGESVTWTNEDEILHTVSAGTREQPGREFDEQLDGAGTSAKVTFDQPGTYEYFCSVHAGMDGSVVVN